MRAITCNRYGDPADVLTVAEVEEPTIGDGDVLIEVEAASVNPADWHLVRATPAIARLSTGLRHPSFQIPGSDVAGRVVAVGASVTTVQPGDEVMASSFLAGFGAFAERVAIAEARVAAKPSNLSMTEAAGVPLAGCTALQAVRDHAEVGPGDRVLVIGASGGVGTFALQLARTAGAEVTGVCSTRNLDLVASLGAARVIDYTSEEVTAGGPYDVILQLAGTARASTLRRSLTRRGRLLQLSGDSANRVVGPMGRILAGQALSALVPQTITSFTVRPDAHDLDVLRGHLESGDVRPVVGRTFSLDDIHAAFAHVESGHGRGKTVVSLTSAVATDGTSIARSTTR
jgi:NADPH:quinone reductase-like Zn-dependent oxidoreductase